MAFLMDSLGLSNPFGTQIGQLIGMFKTSQMYILPLLRFTHRIYYFFYYYFAEKATEGEQVSENWALLLEICDIINETEDGFVFI